jgi:hypothetical protein
LAIRGMDYSTEADCRIMQKARPKRDVVPTSCTISDVEIRVLFAFMHFIFLSQKFSAGPQIASNLTTGGPPYGEPETSTPSPVASRNGRSARNGSD